jgi:uncharacterized membrane protein
MRLFTSNTTDAAAFPLQAVFVPFPFVCFTLTLATDIIFWQTSNIMWQNFSAWLLFAGLIFGGIGMLAGLIDLLRARTRPLRPSLAPILLYILVLALAFLNSLIHAGDGWTAVMPYGLLISAVTFLLLLVALTVSSHKYSRLAWRV